MGTVISERYRVERLLRERGDGGGLSRGAYAHAQKVCTQGASCPDQSNPEVVARFEREAVAAANMKHPNIAAATDFGNSD